MQNRVKAPEEQNSEYTEITQKLSEKIYNYD